MDAFFKGFIAGIPIALSLGPGFLALFQSSLERGYKAGLWMLTGILVGDMMLIVAGYFGLGMLVTHPGNRMIMGVVASVILILMGIFSLIKNPKALEVKGKRNDVSGRIQPASLWMKGFLLNLSNPFNLIFWMGVLAIAGTTFGQGTIRFYGFFAGLFIMTAGADVAKILLSGQLRRLLTPRTVRIIHKSVGALFLVAGVYILMRVV